MGKTAEYKGCPKWASNTTVRGNRAESQNSVPENTIKTNLGINYVLNLTHLARTINSLIGGKSLSKQTTGGLTISQIRERKFQQREIGLDQPTDGELRSRYRFDLESIKYLVKILKDDLQRQTRRNFYTSQSACRNMFSC